MEIHDAANLWPTWPAERFEELKQSIRENGQREAIIVYQNKLLDGRHRYRACQELGIEPKIVELPEDTNPYEYVLDLNGHRRDLTDFQRTACKYNTREQSQAWEKARKAITQSVQEKANSARAEAKAEAVKTQPRSEGGKFGAQPSGAPSGHTSPSPVRHWSETNASRTQAKLAEDLGVGTKAMRTFLECLEHDKKHGTDLAQKAASGDITGTEAQRQIRKAKVHDVPALVGKYRVIYADPPWAYNDKQAISKDGVGESYGPAEAHYSAMSIQQLCDLDVEDIAEDDSVLFLWTTSPLLEKSFEVIKAWGFKYKASFVWDKRAHNMGHYNSVRHEFLLVCTRGSCTPEVGKLFPSVQSIERTDKHSEKPQAFRNIIDTLYPSGNRIELFAREEHDGWETWGNQASAPIVITQEENPEVVVAHGSG